MSQRIFKAVRYIEGRLKDDVRLDEASASACYSHYHFLRMFVAMTGMTVGTYIRRRRLTKAADELLDTTARIIEIAQDAGFESQAAFSRAFKDMFGIAPAAFRQNGKPSTFRGQPEITADYLQHLQIGGVTMKPRFEHREAFTVIGLGKDYNLSNPNTIGLLWNDFHQQKHLIQKVQGREAYGICYAPKEKETFSDQFHYTAALRVEKNTPSPNGMEKIHIPAQAYAVFTHNGPVTDMMKTNVFIWKTWFPQSGLEPADAPDFELYGDKWEGGHNAHGEMEIWVPIIKS